MKRERHAKGFTLVEILVVIGIIIILSALLFPVVTKATERARESSCISQLHQIGIAVQMYQEDHGGRPLRLDALWPQYVSDKKLFVCPDDVWVNKGGWAWSAWGRYTTPPEKWPFPMSYGYFFSTIYADPAWKKVQAQSGRPGYAVCVLHGTPIRSLEAGEASLFSGRTLRLCFDGSVVTRQLPSSGLNTWTLMTDQEKRPDL